MRAKKQKGLFLRAPTFHFSRCFLFIGICIVSLLCCQEECLLFVKECAMFSASFVGPTNMPSRFQVLLDMMTPLQRGELEAVQGALLADPTCLDSPAHAEGHKEKEEKENAL